MSRTILEINTKKHEPVFVAIDGQRYKLLPLGSLDLFRQIRLQAEGARLGPQLQKIDTLNEEELRDLSTRLAALVSIVLEAPKDLHDSLTDEARLNVALAWMAESQRRAEPAAAARKRGAKR